MGKPITHAISSAKKLGGSPDDYIEIHAFMDSSKGALADNRHRALTHNSWFLTTILPLVFGQTITNSDGKMIDIRTIGEQHVLEDFGGKFIPTAQDWIDQIPMADWMNNASRGDVPPSIKSVRDQRVLIND